jgi:hypothetical protein
VTNRIFRNQNLGWKDLGSIFATKPGCLHEFLELDIPQMLKRGTMTPVIKTGKIQQIIEESL